MVTVMCTTFKRTGNTSEAEEEKDGTRKREYEVDRKVRSAKNDGVKSYRTQKHEDVKISKHTKGRAMTKLRRKEKRRK